MTLRADSPPSCSTIFLNCWRFSPRSIASMDAPISSTPYFSRTPALSRAIAQLSAVWPMMIGPEPMTRTLWMSVRLGMSGVLPVGHEIAEPVEEVRRIVRAGCRLGVVLDREARQPAVGVAELESLDDVVVEAHVADRRLAELGRRRALERSVDREAVVVGGDLDLAGGAVHHRLVDAAVAVLQLVGAEAEGAAEELVAEADAEVGDAR